MATHQVSLFLPYTIAFHESPTLQQRPTFDQRSSSTADLPSLKGVSSLLSASTEASTPSGKAAVDFFASQSSSDLARIAHARPGDPRSLVRSDAHLSDWGKQAIFNQPKSRAGPLPSGSILDFAKVQGDIERKRQDAKIRSTHRSPPGRKSRAGSNDRGYEGKVWTVEPAIHGNGGLTNAVRAAGDAGDMEISWIGTVGFPTDALSMSLKEEIRDKLLTDHESEVVYVSDKDLDGHYTHFCKTILWPIFHYQVPDHPKSKAYADHSWKFYRNVNEAFANKVIASYKRGDTIWVHDYHLLLVPQMVREKLPHAKIGFFLHTAFPSSEVFRCLAMRKELLEGVLGANLVAFQTEEYASHFLQTCSRLLTVETLPEGVQLENHFVNVTSEAIGIYPSAVADSRDDPEVKQWIEAIQERYKDKKLIVSRDKLDNVRGVRQKLLAYELFLNKHPEWREKVVLIQVASASSEQSELMTTVSDICTRIDSVHSTLAHQPLVFLKQDIGFSQYLALLSIADVLMVTALRDGMNLTTHEYIFCQDGQATNGLKRHGPVILSEFTGSASVFGSAHLSINPWDYQQQANIIKYALEMGEKEKDSRWSKLHNIVMTHTGGRWVKVLNETLDRVYQEQAERDSSSVPRLSVNRMADAYDGSNTRVFILDYEGTLAPLRTSMGVPLTSPQRVLDALSELMADSRNIIYVMSARRPEELASIFRGLPSLGLIAEDGCFVREFGAASREWQQFIDDDKTASWKEEVRSILKYYSDRLEGSSIEERHASFVFRWDKVEDQDVASRFAGESVDQINSACKSMNINAVPIQQAILIEQTEFTKCTAAEHIFRNLRRAHNMSKPDFLLVAGDDREDEVVFNWANSLAKEGTVRNVYTVSVGKRNTVAQASLTQGSSGLLNALLKLAKISSSSIGPDYLNKGASST
ncbi:glycosyltransferase family 20 protein [Piedraia hortae CBS 480.64]|uniref:Glycosyltransferase family 20 protein n=1 Tax=Piedraia hortae CBS 480.64 TaxID=1314780 RepID=A0A6A7C809_9PEZI|nr:glycosyltransferase family 20 protein [Piedraia hortae CBS 480.64]